MVAPHTGLPMDRHLVGVGPIGDPCVGRWFSPGVYREEASGSGGGSGCGSGGG